MTRFGKLLTASIFGGFLCAEIGSVSDLAFLGVLNPVSTAQARIGRPLTPLSYAGVARRTARRTTRRVIARQIAVLPPACVYGLYYGHYYYNCGGVYYARSGGVYVEVVVR